MTFLWFVLMKTVETFNPNNSSWIKLTQKNCIKENSLLVSEMEPAAVVFIILCLTISIQSLIIPLHPNMDVQGEKPIYLYFPIQIMYDNTEVLVICYVHFPPILILETMSIIISIDFECNIYFVLSWIASLQLSLFATRHRTMRTAYGVPSQLINSI